MQNKPFFSVIVPIFGVEEFLPKCIDSILSQTFTDFELILVDDGSKDNCAKICDEYAKKDNRIIVIHKTNGGQTSARQAGIKKANGKYVACIDGDDFVAPGYLNSFVNTINKTDAMIVCSGSIWWTNDNLQTVHAMTISEEFYNRERIEQEIFPYLIEDSNSKYFSNSVWAKVFELELYKKHCLQLNCVIKIGEDAACVKPCIAEASSLAIIPDCLYFYRQNSGSMTKNKKAFDWNGPQLILEHYLNVLNLEACDFRQQVYRNCVHNIFNVVVSRFYQDLSKKIIYKEIKKELKRPLYRECLSKAYFKFGSKGWLAHASLKYKWLFLIYIFSKRSS